MILEFTFIVYILVINIFSVYILYILMDLQHAHLPTSHLEALDAGQVVQLLCRLHRDAAGQGRVLPLHG